MLASPSPHQDLLENSSHSHETEKHHLHYRKPSELSLSAFPSQSVSCKDKPAKHSHGRGLRTGVADQPFPGWGRPGRKAPGQAKCGKSFEEVLSTGEASLLLQDWSHSQHKEDPGTQKRGWGNTGGREGRGQSAGFPGENLLLKVGTEGRKCPPGVTSLNESEGSSLPQPPPSVTTSRWETHAPKLSATPVPRCVMDIAMGRDHLKNNQAHQQNRAQHQGGLRRCETKHSPSIPRQLCAAGRLFLHSELFKESSQSNRGETGEFAEAAREWQMPLARVWEGEGCLLRKLKGRCNRRRL